MEIDRRRAPKERLLGIPDNRLGGTAFPFSELDKEGAARVVHASVSGTAVVVFWDRSVQGAMAYRPRLDGEAIFFDVRNDKIVDTSTGSTWRLDGEAIDGPLKGRQLEPIAEAYVSFWFSWAAFHTETAIWEG